MKSTRHHGFTLIELMIVVAVVGILATVAYPAYLVQIQKSRRAEVQASLMHISARQQQMLLDTRSYATTLGALNVTLPNTVQQSYAVTMSVGTATVPTFTATATPSGAQASDYCGVLSINQRGTKSPSSCW